MDFENNALIEATLRLADYGRTNNFDLIQKEGYVFLREEIVKDFPYLTLAELNTIITDGVKGGIDPSKTPRPLNCTRIYQWVKARVVYSQGYWANRHPDLMAWAEQLGLEAEVMSEIDNYETPAAAFAEAHKFRQLLQRVVRETFYPNLDIDPRNNVLNAAKFQHQTEQYLYVSTVEYPAYLLQHPALITSSQPIF